MTLTLAHQRAAVRSKKHAKEFFVVREEQNDGTFFDVCTAFDLETFYNGIGDENILACYENGEMQP